MLLKQISWRFWLVSPFFALSILWGSSKLINLLLKSTILHHDNFLTSLPTPQPLKTLSGHSTWIYTLAASRNGRFLASGSYDKQIKVWHLPSGRLYYSLDGHGDAVSTLTIGQDNQYLVSGSWDNRIKVWNLETGQLIRTLQGHRDDVESVSMSLNSQWLASGSTDQTIRVWNLQTGENTRQFQDHHWVRAVAFNADGQTIVSGNEAGEIKIWRPSGDLAVPNVSDRTPITSLKAHTQAVRSLAFSPDGQLLASSSSDGTVKLWRWRTQQLLQTLPSPTQQPVWSVAFSPDGQTLGIAGYDRTIGLWQVSTGKFRRQWIGHDKSVASVVFSACGKMLASGSADQTVNLWSMPIASVTERPPKPRPIAKSQLGRSSSIHRKPSQRLERSATLR